MKFNKLRLKAIEQESKRFIDQDLNSLEGLQHAEKYICHRSKPYSGTIDDRRAKVLACIEKQKNQAIMKINAEIEEIENATDNLPNSLIISVEWKKSRMWGMNPCATDNYSNYATASGCGYDKLSAVTAKILNSHLPILKRMYKVKNRNIDKLNRDVLGYGSGYFVLPRFEGGVGFDCHRRILEDLGYKVEKHGTSSSDIIIITEKGA